jgi:hypothetical protein
MHINRLPISLSVFFKDQEYINILRILKQNQQNYKAKIDLKSDKNVNSYAVAQMVQTKNKMIQNISNL